ncbi:MAG: cell wall hydrolase [Eubacteriales bacterium]
MNPLLKDFYPLTDEKILAICIWGEARGEPFEAKLAVASVIKERVRRGGWYGKGYHGVILKDKQFSCFNPFDPNFIKMIDLVYNFDEENNKEKNKVVWECYKIAKGIITGNIKPNIVATNYLSIYCDVCWENKLKKVATIGRHDFYI